MGEKKAKKQLEAMLLSYSPGSILMLLGQVFGELAEEARLGGSEGIAANYEEAEATMNVVGFGLDAILPKPKLR